MTDSARAEMQSEKRKIVIFFSTVDRTERENWVSKMFIF